MPRGWGDVSGGGTCGKKSRIIYLDFSPGHNMIMTVQGQWRPALNP
jgi:hypothetical protein